MVGNSCGAGNIFVEGEILVPLEIFGKISTIGITFWREILAGQEILQWDIVVGILSSREMFWVTPTGGK